MKTVTNDSTWASTNAAIARVSSSGLLTAVASGSAQAIATYQRITGSLTVSVQQALVGLTCGEERWPVKTLSDPDASRVNLSNVQVTTIKALNQFATHCATLPDARAYAEEFQVYEVVGRIIASSPESDLDYHIAVADMDDPTYTIVTETPDPNCDGVVNSPYRQALIQARSAFDALVAGRPISALVGTVVRIRGVGFYDFAHGQTGRSQSCIELHPIFGIERAQ